MVTANLDGLKQYLCDKSGPVTATQTRKSLNAYPFNGSQDGKIPQKSIVGIDLNTDGTIDAYIGSSPLMLEKFITGTNDFPEYTGVGAWGTPVSIPQEQVAKLMAQCEEWQPLESDFSHYAKLTASAVSTAMGLIWVFGGIKAVPAWMIIGGPAITGTYLLILAGIGLFSLYSRITENAKSGQRVEDTLLQSAYHLLGFNN